ncbi:glycoside hydrolase family 16 protein [Corynebacterium antarcticum]|uniref:glycoside hydrolase family 16 protein n=1 Tax=Corynebacterium antarcticum TaxID=2800405 RepID=UPI002260BA53|nr:family 16 glycosylhydrolase [Corynebacterium antarcticum]MCX7541018.1 family 16 glycosylhydrolase [Corynebacterium antarcticum]
MPTFHRLRLTSTAVLATSAVVLGALAPVATASEPPVLSKPYEWTEDFDSADALDGWLIFNQPDYLNKNVTVTPDAVEVRDGMLVITTARHCIEKDGDPLTDANIVETPCPENMITRYTTGRLHSDWVASGFFTVNVRAKFHTGGVKGVRSAIWMQNDQPACHAGATDSSYGELDIIEHYSWPWRSKHSPATVHFGCNESGTIRDGRVFSEGKDIAENWHTWTLQTTTDDLRFSIDGKPILHESGPPFDEKEHITPADLDISDEKYREILSRPYRLILNQYVEVKDWAHPASDSDPFPVRQMFVDSITLKGQPFTAEELNPPTTPTDEPTTPTTPTDEPTTPATPTDEPPVPGSSTPTGQNSWTLLGGAFTAIIGALSVFTLVALPIIGWLHSTVQLNALLRSISFRM